jgi:YbbR domain-containing protein
MPLRDVITKDVGWKILSVALALAIWFTVHNATNDGTVGTNPLTGTATRTFDNLPVLKVSAAADVRAFKVQPDTVAVVVSGRSDVLDALTERDIRVMVDLTGIESARSLRKHIDVSTPPGVTFVRAEPSAVEVVIPARKEN